MKSIDAEPLLEAIGKQRLLFMAVMGLNAPGVDANLTAEEIGGLTTCISETINLLQGVIDAVD
jgi:hypothetical protein